MPKIIKPTIYIVILFAFLTRFSLGFAAAVLLPQVGYETKSQQGGYLFFDAYRRDSQAWDLAQSAKPLIRAFDDKFSSDQYGGLLWLSAFIYRYLSSGTHQPLLIVFLAALVSAIGVLFVYRTALLLAVGAGLKPAPTEKNAANALLAASIFAFFPEAILLGASQMREPFLMTFIAMSFYGLVEWQAAHSKTSWIWIFISMAGMLFISPGFVLVTLVALAGWIYFSVPAVGQTKRGIPWQVTAAAVGVFIVALFVLTASWDSLISIKGGGMPGIIANWARGTARWNAYLLGRSSGIVQLLFQALPPVLAFPFVAVYGVLQPVLPAAIFEPGIPFWQFIGIIRSLGWYLLLPLIAFAPFAANSMSDSQRRKQWLWLAAVVWGWILIAALRGGGDQWDNPRYRVILLVWLALLAITSKVTLNIAGYTTRSGVLSGTQDIASLRKGNPKRWFWRICSVEAVVLLVFGHWYSWRYLGFGFNIGIRSTLLLAIGISVLIVAGDWLFQRFKPSSRL